MGVTNKACICETHGYSPPFLARWLSVPVAGTFRCRYCLGLPLRRFKCLGNLGLTTAQIAGAAAACARGVLEQAPLPCRRDNFCKPHGWAPYLGRTEATYEGSARCTRSLCTCALYGLLPLILFVFSPDRCTGMLECVT